MGVSVLDWLKQMPSDAARRKWLELEWDRKRLTFLMQSLDPNGVWLDELGLQDVGSIAPKAQMIETMLRWVRDM